MTREKSSGSAPRVLSTLILCSLVLAIDGYDLAAMPLAIPHVAKTLNLAPTSFGLALSAVLAGLGLGAMFLAPLGDRFGRRRVIVIAAIGIGLCTMATASGASTKAFVLWRFLTGLSLGACLPNVNALTAISAPSARRASTFTLVSLAIPLGGIAAGLVAPRLVAEGGWRAIFLIPGVVTLVLAGALLLLLPDEDAPDGSSGADREPLGQILAPPLRSLTIIFVLLYGLNAFALYLVTSWTPTILPDAGFSLDQASHSIAIIQFGGLVIGLGLAPLLDRGWATAAITGSYLVAVASFALLAVAQPDPWTWNLLLLVAAGGISGIHLSLMAVVAGLYPPRCLATAIGFGVAVGRFGAIGGPLMGGWLLQGGTPPATFFLWTTVPVMACALLSCLLPAAARAIASSKSAHVSTLREPPAAPEAAGQSQL